MNLWQKSFSFALVWAFASTSQVAAQPPIVLRDLTLLRNASVIDFDDAGIVLSDGNKLGWDIVLKAQTTPDRQADFDRRIVETGLPLFRLKNRIKNSDWAAAGEIAEPLLTGLSSAAAGRLDPDTIYLLHLASMNSRLQRGARADAVWNFIQAASIQETVSPQALRLVGTGRLPDRDTKFQLSQEILPIWFEPKNLEATVAKLMTLIKDGNKPAPGLVIYLASMKMELGQLQSASELTKTLDSVDEEMASWKVVLESRIATTSGDRVKGLAMLERNNHKFAGGAKPVAYYYRGIAALDFREPKGFEDPVDIDRSKAILILLRIPALYGDMYRHLSAAAIFQSAEITKLRGLRDEEQKLKDELLQRYPRTFHGSQKTTQMSN